MIAARRSVMILMIGAALGASLAPAQSPRSGGGASKAAWELPGETQRWINSPPLSRESLKGKGIVFYFFEEECEPCAEKWPDLQRQTAPYANEPVLFFAVNSGTDPRALRNYVKQNRVGWPVIADVDRSLERQLGISPLTPPERTPDDRLERLATRLGTTARERREMAARRPRSRAIPPNTVAVVYVNGSGSMSEGDLNDFAGTVQKAREGAKWRVDPADIPAPLRGAWRAVEVGAYSEAAGAVTKATKGRDGPLKTGGDLLLSAVKEDLQADVALVREAFQQSRKWDAYKQLDSLVDRYDGFGLTDNAKEKLKELGKDETIRREISARKTLDKAIRTGSKGGASARRARGMLERLIENSPNTEAAAQAQRLLSQG